MRRVLAISLRIPALGLVAAALTACATSPAPVASRVPVRPPVAWAAPSFEGSGSPRVVDEGAPLQCVPYARIASGIDIYGDANTWWTQAEGRYPRSNSPSPGSVFVMRGYRDPSRGHVAVVTEIVSPRVIKVNQANWLNRGEITIGVPVTDVSPNNDWTEVRVWYIPNQEWGARTYSADGFIHPFPFATMS